MSGRARFLMCLVAALFALTSGAGRAVADEHRECHSARHLSALSMEDRYVFARGLAWKGNLDSAECIFLGLVKDDPGNVDYLFGYAQIKFWRGDTLVAHRYLERARQLAPDYEDVWQLEYRTLQVLPNDEVAMSISDFRQLAAVRFPQSDWYESRIRTSAETGDWRLFVDHQWLDNSRQEWLAMNVAFGVPIGNELRLLLSADPARRFGTSDNLLGVGISTNARGKWSAGASARAATAAVFYPRVEAEIFVERKLGGGWLSGLSFKRAYYTADSVSSWGAHVDRYFQRLRVGYAVRYASLASQSGMIGQFSLGFDGKNAAHYEVIFATGDEIEMVAANQLSQTRVTGAAVFGSFPVTERLFLHWRLMTHKQGSFYRRIGLGVGVSGGF